MVITGNQGKPMRQITVEIEDADCEKLDRWAQREGRKRGNLARRIIAAAVERRERCELAKSKAV
jgi:hypothetical protein